MIYWWIQDFIYNSKNYWKEAIIINSDNDISDNIYAKIDKNFLAEMLSDTLMKKVSLIYNLEYEDLNTWNQIIIKNDTFKYLKVIIHDGNSQTQENIWEKFI